MLARWNICALNEASINWGQRWQRREDSSSDEKEFAIASPSSAYNWILFKVYLRTMEKQ